MISKNIGWNAFANVYGQFVTVGIQLLAVPIFLSKWTLEQYGVWLLISAVPTYMALTDFGLVGAISNRVAILRESGNLDAAQKEFGIGVVLLIALGLLSFTIVCAISFAVLPFFEWGTDIQGAFLILCATGILSIYPYIGEIVLRAENENAVGIFFTNTARLIEWVCGAYGVYYNGDYGTVALYMLAGRLISISIIILVVVIKHPLYMAKIKWHDTSIAKALVTPSLAFLAFPIGNAMSIQGVSLVAGIALGPAHVAIISVYRTYSRILVQLCTVICHSVWPEVSRLYAIKDNSKIRSLFKRTEIAAKTSVMIVGTALLVASEKLIPFWVGSHFIVNYWLICLYLISAATLAWWMPTRVFLMAVSLHKEVSIDYMIASLILCGLTYVACTMFGVFGVPISLIFIELYLISKTRPRIAAVGL